MRMSLIMAAIALELTTGAATAQTAPAATAPKPDKPICRSWADIGTLVPNHRECHTRAEWNAIANNNNTATRDAMEQNRGASPPQL